MCSRLTLNFSFFFFNDTATTEIYTLSLHDALPIFEFQTRWDKEQSRRDGSAGSRRQRRNFADPRNCRRRKLSLSEDRKSTRLNSSHLVISYAVFCLNKKSIVYLTHIFPTD